MTELHCSKVQFNNKLPPINQILSLVSIFTIKKCTNFNLHVSDLVLTYTHTIIKMYSMYSQLCVSNIKESFKKNTQKAHKINFFSFTLFEQKNIKKNGI